MIKKLTKGLLTLSIFALLLVPVFSLNAQDYAGHYMDMGDTDIMLDDSLQPRETAVGIINLILSFLGLVAVVIVLIGGFKWMTAGGSEEKVGAAKKLLIGGLVGLVIVLLAWGITTWIIDTIPDLAQ